MKNAVMIKSFPNGISVYMEDDIPFEDLLIEIREKFTEASNFFKDAKMAISFDGRALNEAEEKKILDIIAQTTQISIICIVGKNEVKNQIYLKALKQIEKKDDKNFAQIHKGTLKDHEVLESEKTLVILGDVYPECAVSSSRDIIILGGLYGEAYAGTPEDEDHFVLALEMQPEKMRIGDSDYRPDKPAKWGIKPKIMPKIAYVKKGRVVTEPVTKELLSEIAEL